MCRFFFMMTGKFSKDSGATECQTCEAGRFASNSGATECAECTEGSTTNGVILGN